MSDRNHVLSMNYELLPSDRHHRFLKVKPHTPKSFIPYLIRIYIPHHDHNTCYQEVCKVETIVILYVAHCDIVYCTLMMFIYCMYLLSTTTLFHIRANKVCLIISYNLCLCTLILFILIIHKVFHIYAFKIFPFSFLYVKCSIVSCHALSIRNVYAFSFFSWLFWKMYQCIQCLTISINGENMHR